VEQEKPNRILDIQINEYLFEASLKDSFYLFDFALETHGLRVLIGH
jgi:hypothetical protein